MRLTLQLTAVDMLSGVLSVARQQINRLGETGKKVQKDFDQMTTHLTRGLKAIAVADFGFKKLNAGVNAAASLQEAMGNVQMDIMRSGQSAADLNDKLARVRSTAVSIQAFTPFSSEDVVQVEDALLKAGLQLKDVVGKGGAAWAASALATITGNSPQAMAAVLPHIAIPFKVSGKDYGHLADQLQRLSVASGANVMDLAAQLKDVAGQAAASKIPLQEVLGTIGVLFKQGQGPVAGHALSMFMTMLAGITPQSVKAMKEIGINAYDAQGHIKPMIDIIDQLRSAFAKLTDQQKQQAAVKIFSRRGERVALALLGKGSGSYEDILQQMREQASLQSKINEKTTQYITNLHALQTTWKSTVATFFDPLLKPITTWLQGANDVVAKLGEIGEAHKGLTTAVSGTLGLGVAAAGGYGIWQLLKAAGAARRVLAGVGGIKGLLGNLGGTAVGVGEGKAIQAATGVAPVFVTNWPANFGAGSTVAEAAGTAAMARKFSSAAEYMKIAGTATLVGAIGIAMGKGVSMALDALTTKADRVHQIQYAAAHPETKLTHDQYMEWASLNTEKEKQTYIEIHVHPNRVTTKTNDINHKITAVKRGDQ